MFELPFMRSTLRQAHPKAVFSRLNPGHGLGITAGAQMPMRPIKKLANGGMNYDDGGQIDMGSLNSPMASLDPYINGGTSQSHYDGSNFNPGQFSPEQVADKPTGLGGWLENRHAGIPGSNWLQAALTAFSGILSGVMANKGGQKAINNNTQYAPAFGQIGFSQGGIMGCGGMSTGDRYMGDGNVYAGGGILSGPGDGMSDQIPANGGQIKVSPGEYVLDADTVSAIGNGDTKAGAQKLDMARASLRKKKYGRSMQPPKIHDGANPLLNAIR